MASRRELEGLAEGDSVIVYPRPTRIADGVPRALARVGAFYVPPEMLLSACWVRGVGLRR
jgi:hypothetical protein